MTRGFLDPGVKGKGGGSFICFCTVLHCTLPYRAGGCNEFMRFSYLTSNVALMWHSMAYRWWLYVPHPKL